VRRRKDGQHIDVAVTISPICDAEGKFVGASKVVRDISGRKRTEAELVQALRSTEAANRELEAFSYSVAHDLRAPLRGIDGFSQALLTDYSDQLEEGGKRYLRKVRELAQRMAGLIDDLLSLAQVTRGSLGHRRVDLTAMIRGASQRLIETDPTREVDIVIQEGLSAMGDERLLRIAMDNLLGNAWKFSRNNPRALIEIGCERESGTDIFFVRDNGAGFDMRFYEKLFGVFQRLHTEREFEGTGIGLVIVQRIVQRHGGSIWATGEVSVGATFYFSLSQAGEN
jgi:light-regulated signal transduction histidine kinase (bacteriophytochrome)